MKGIWKKGMHGTLKGEAYMRYLKIRYVWHVKEKACVIR
jgi:hypothetical protein